jgi:hypothetical protein
LEIVLLGGAIRVDHGDGFLVLNIGRGEFFRGDIGEPVWCFLCGVLMRIFIHFVWVSAFQVERRMRASYPR